MAYITLDEFDILGGPERVIAEYPELSRSRFIAAAVAQADEYLAKVYTVPLADGAVTMAMKLHIARMAFYFLVSSSGYDPGSDDGVLHTQYEDAVKYFQRIALGTVLIPGGTSGGSSGSLTPPGGPAPAAEAFYSDARGW